MERRSAMARSGAPSAVHDIWCAPESGLVSIGVLEIENRTRAERRSYPITTAKDCI